MAITVPGLQLRGVSRFSSSAAGPETSGSDGGVFAQPLVKPALATGQTLFVDGGFSAT